MASLIEAKEATGAANEELVLAVLAAAGDGGVAPAEMSARSSLADRTWRSVVARLATKNLARRDGARGRIYITSAGRSEAGANLDGVALAGSLGHAVGLFPTEGHRALLRLLISNVIARHHLHPTLTRNWGSFVVVGPTKAGKTAVAEFVARAFGFPSTASIRLAPAMTPGAVWGRTERLVGQWSFDPSPILSQPFVCLDEVDKAPSDTLASIMRLVQGDTEVASERGLTASVRPTTLLCGNGKVSSVRPEYRRRSVVLDLWQHEALLEDVPAAMRAVFSDGAIPHLNLDGYRPPTALGPEVLEVVIRTLKESLTRDGWLELDELAVERMALGRCVLVADRQIAALATVHDYLTCAATIGHVRAVPDSLREALGGTTTPLGPNVEAAERESREPVRRAAKRLEDEIEFQRAQGELVQKLDSWCRGLDRRRIPESDKETAAGLRKVIVLLRQRAGQQVTLTGIQEIKGHALPEVTKAKDLLDRIEQSRTEAERARVREHDAKVFAAEQERIRRQAAKEEHERANKRLAIVRRDIGVLEKLYRRSTTKPGERADSQLAALRLSSGFLLELVTGPNQLPRPTFRRRNAPAPPPHLPDAWRSRFDHQVTFRAAGASCPDLASWGQNTRRVLAPALLQAYGEEERLLALTGRRATRRRLDVT